MIEACVILPIVVVCYSSSCPTLTSPKRLSLTNVTTWLTPPTSV